MITLYKRQNGAFLTTIRAETDRSWVMNNKGKCTIYLSTKDEKMIRTYMGKRNLVCIDHPKLPLWGGVIETDQEWDENGGVRVTAWSGESLLMSRCPTDGLVQATSPGALFEKLIGIANRTEDMLIRPGSIYRGGGAAECTLDGTNLLEVIRDLALRWDMEFEIVPNVNGKGNLSFVANWYQRMGEVSPYLLREGFNVKKNSRVLRITRRVINKLTGFGEGSTDDARPTFTAEDAESIALFGVMEGVEDYDGVVNESTVKEHVLERLKVLRYPKVVINLTALDVEETLEKIRMGNTHTFRATSFGLKGTDGVGIASSARVIAMRYLETVNELEFKNQTEDYYE